MSDYSSPIDAISLPNLNDVVYDRLREAILRLEFEPGERLNLPELEEKLQVSRTPLKNALTRLEMEGLVAIHPRRGTFISEVSKEKLEEEYKIRSAYELYVALCIYKYLSPEDYVFFDNIWRQMNELAHKAESLGWQNVIHKYLLLDYALHERFVVRGGPPRMIVLWQQTNVHMQVSRIAGRLSDYDCDMIHFEHQQILDALHFGSPERLSASLLNHLESSRFRVVSILKG